MCVLHLLFGSFVDRGWGRHRRSRPPRRRHHFHRLHRVQTVRVFPCVLLNNKCIKVAQKQLLLGVLKYCRQLNRTRRQG